MEELRNNQAKILTILEIIFENFKSYSITIELLNKDYRAIINRSSLLGYRDQFLEELKKKSIKILGDIPLDDDIVNSYCQGKPLMAEKSEFKGGEGYKSFQKIFENLKTWLKNNDSMTKGN